MIISIFLIKLIEQDSTPHVFFIRANSNRYTIPYISTPTVHICAITVLPFTVERYCPCSRDPYASLPYTAPVTASQLTICLLLLNYKRRCVILLLGTAQYGRSLTANGEWARTRFHFNILCRCNCAPYRRR